MKISDAIAQIQNLKQNQYDTDTFIRWLSDLDGSIYEEVILKHAPVLDAEGAEIAVEHGPYTSADSDLMVPDPYSDVYIKYLAAQIDYYNGELARYNNSMVLYNIALSTFADWYNRNHLPNQDNYVRI